MKIRADIAELLHAGHSDAAIERQLNTDHRTVAKARAALGIAPCRPGKPAAASVEDLFWRRTQPTDDGHLLWNGHRNRGGVPCLRYGGVMHTAFRVAFRIRHDREPIGRVIPGCDREGCVHPDHVDDRPMRDRNRAAFNALFGGVL